MDQTQLGKILVMFLEYFNSARNIKSLNDVCGWMYTYSSMNSQMLLTAMFTKQTSAAFVSLYFLDVNVNSVTIRVLDGYSTGCAS